MHDLKRGLRLRRDRLRRVCPLATPVKRSDLSNVKHRVRTSSEEIGEVRIAIVKLHSSLPSWVQKRKSARLRGSAMTALCR